MPLKPESVIHPFQLEVRFEAGGHKHLLKVDLKSPVHYGTYRAKLLPQLAQELDLFMVKALAPVAPPPAQQPAAIPPGEAGEKALDN